MLDAARRWQYPLELLFTSGPVSLVILAPLTAQAETCLRGVVGRTAARMREVVPEDRFADMLTLLFIFMGFRHEATTVMRIMDELGLRQAIAESDLYIRIRDHEAARQYPT